MLSARNKKPSFVIIMTVVIIIIALYKFFMNAEDTQDSSHERKDSPEMETDQKFRSRFASVLSLLDLKARFCEDLSKDWKALNMSRTYHERLKEFEDKLNEALKGTSDGEGHSNQVPEEMRVLHLLAGVQRNVTVCETGFNYGHSAFNFLTAGDDVRVFSFDIGSHSYAPKMAEHLRSMFGARRLHVEFGDSRSSVANFKSKGHLPPCDVIFVDGGHTLEVASADVVNLSEHASEDNVIIMDDHPTDWSGRFGRAWDAHLLAADQRSGQEKEKDNEGGRFSIEELIRCTRRQKVDDLSRGFVVGRVVKHRK